MNADTEYSIARDPLFLITAAFFAPLTTVGPALLGQHRLMPMMQALALVAFMAVALRQRAPRRALLVVAIWVALQLVVMIALGALASGSVEQAIPDGFALHSGLLEWAYTDVRAPGGVQATPLQRLLELVIVLAGSLLTGGLVGAWVLVRTVNQTGFAIGVLLSELEGVGFLVALLPWALLRIAAYTGIVTLLAEPLWSRNWSPGHYLSQRRQLVLISIILLIISLALEAILPPIWPGLFR